MNKAALPILSRLRALQAESRHAPDGARIIASQSDAAPLAAMMRELNETMLGRALTFTSGTGARLTLEVSGRRVLRLMDASGLAGVDSCLAAETLEDEQKDDLLTLLQALASQKAELRVSSGPLGRSVEGLSVGLPVALLADLLLVDLNPTADAPAPEPVQLQMVVGGRSIRTVRSVQAPPLVPPPVVAPPSPAEAEDEPADAPAAQGLAAFARSLGPLLMAWLTLGGAEDGASDGPEEMVSHLRDFLGDESEALHRQLDLVASAEEPACLMLGTTLVEGNGVLCARLEGGLLLALIDGDSANAVLQGWMALHA